jgi:hypothetical protein
MIDHKKGEEGREERKAYQSLTAILEIRTGMKILRQ